MPDRETILRRLGRLPTKPLRLITDDGRFFWEGTEDGAHFLVTKDVFPPPMGMTSVSLSVSGDPVGREKIMSDFRAVLGNELTSDIQQGKIVIEYVLWDATALKQQKPS